MKSRTEVPDVPRAVAGGVREQHAAGRGCGPGERRHRGTGTGGRDAHHCLGVRQRRRTGVDNADRRALAAGGAKDDALLRSAIKIKIDHRLHAERVVTDRSKRTHTANRDELPDGVFVLLSERERGPCLVLGDAVLTGTAGGYDDRIDRPRGITVNVLTPELTVRAIRGGCVPELHPTAHQLLARPT